MRNNLYKYSLLCGLGVFFLNLSACKKSDSPYHDYENTVQTFDGSAYDYLKAQPKGTFDSLLLVLERYPTLIDSLKTQELTLFAPVNKSFETAEKYLNQKRVAEGHSLINLSNADPIGLGIMICKYVIRGNRTSDAYLSSVDGTLQNSILIGYPMQIKNVKLSSSGYQSGGPTRLNFSDPKGSFFTKDWITTTTDAVNIKTTNATVNIITSQHNFGFDEFTKRLDK
ncbi:hypothetical protein [Pedobacter gandavensis]|uniref:hypothetical protein n=1 Tax=Pedobacter gandavensis TaxID=2679963 RepID=UPI00293082FB|nr:hypothetical protein [Pedobacter gandavensis]